MSATISYVLGCAPSTMVAYGTRLADCGTEFVNQVDLMRRDVAATADGWRGAGAAAASARAVGGRLSATHIDETTARVAEYLIKFGEQLDQTKIALLHIVDGEIPAAGMTVADDGAVTAPRVPGNSLAAMITQVELDLWATMTQDRIRGLLNSFAVDEQLAADSIAQGIAGLHALQKAPTGPMPELPSVAPQHSTDGRYTIGQPKPVEVAHDDSFVYKSRPPTGEDFSEMLRWNRILRAGETLRDDLDDATTLYRHFWGNTGKPMGVDYSEAYREDPAIRRAVDREVGLAVKAADELVRMGNTNFVMSGGRSTIGEKSSDYPETENWQKSLGGYQQSAHANVRVEGKRVIMDVTVEANDYYNFDRGKTDMRTGEPDDANGRFIEVGWAKPFETHGSVTKTVSWEVGQPPPTGAVVGTSEPNSDRGGEDRSDGRSSGTR